MAFNHVAVSSSLTGADSRLQRHARGCWSVFLFRMPISMEPPATRRACAPPGAMTMSCIVLAETKNRISISMRCVPMVIMMMSFNCSCVDSLCKVKGLRYLRLVESMRYSQRALFFALFLSFLQPAISQDTGMHPGDRRRASTGNTYVRQFRAGSLSIRLRGVRCDVGQHHRPSQCLLKLCHLLVAP
jgi:hypothetical protein